MRKVFEDEVERLANNPEKIYSSWGDFGPLFDNCGKPSVGNPIGCLTQVKNSHWHWVAQTPEMTEKIMADDRIHYRPEELQDAVESEPDIEKRKDILRPYAEYQDLFVDLGWNDEPETPGADN